MKILVTGALGFQGIHIAALLTYRGHQVTVLNTPSERARTIMLPALLGMIDSRLLIDVVLGSVTDADTLEKIIPGHDAVIHMAAWASVDQSLDRPWPPWEVNATGTLAVLESARRFGKPNLKTVIASSCEVYGPAERPKGDFIPQDERWPMLPRSPYAASKIAGDRMAYAYAVTYGMDVIILRPSNVYGPWQRHGGFGAVIPTFVKRALHHEPLVITGGGKQSREFLHVLDVALAYLKAVESPDIHRGDVYNVGSGEVVTILELAQLITAQLGGEITYSDARVADVSGFFLNSWKFASQFGWLPTLSFKDGLTEYIDWARGLGEDAWR